MYNLKKKLLTMACVVGMTGLGYASSAKAFESKIPIDSPVAETMVVGPGANYPGIITIKTLENGVRITEMDKDRDGKLEGIMIYQPGTKEPGKFMTGILETDEGADGDVDYRITFNDDGSAWYEEQLPDGSVEIELIKG